MNDASNVVHLSVFANPEALRRQTTEAFARGGLSKVRRARKAKQEPGAKFVMVPVEWMDRLFAAHIGAAAMRLAMVFAERMQWEQTFIVAHAVMAEAKVTRNHKREALLQLEKAGIIAIEWRGSRAPRVTPYNPFRR